MSKKRLAIRITAAIWTVVFMVVIVFNSSLNGDKSAYLSGKVLSVVKKLLPSHGGQGGESGEGGQGKLHLYIRKLAHFSEFFGLSVGVAVFLMTFESIKKILAGVYALIFCVLFAVSDEVHQRFVSGRAMSVLDVVIDGAGCLLGICVVYLLIYFIIAGKKRKKKEKDIE